MYLTYSGDDFESPPEYIPFSLTILLVNDEANLILIFLGSVKVGLIRILVRFGEIH